MFKNILVAVDGSEQSLKAASVAGDLARSMQADLVVLVAFDPMPSYLGYPNLEEAIQARMVQSEEIMSRALAETGDLPNGYKKEILEGPPAEAILTVAETRQVDLIVMGTRGLGRLVSALVGSQSQKVIGHAKCPVLLVR